MSENIEKCRKELMQLFHEYGGAMFDYERCEHALMNFAIAIRKTEKSDPSIDEWIEELKGKAEKNITNCVKGELYGNGRLDGHFIIQQLEALLNHMKRYQK